MKRAVEQKQKSWVKPVLLTILAFVVIFMVILPLSLTLIDGDRLGNVARIPIYGPITGTGEKLLGRSTASSQLIVGFIEQAERNPRIEAIVLEINSPGGSAVASNEIASAVKRTEKPVIALIRELGASGGYWIASAADYVIADRMSITGSIGVLSSYLEFSRLMEEYGVGYERLVAGEYKDVGTPFRSLESDERALLQQKLDTIHAFFIQEIAANRKLPEAAVRQLATGEFFLGVEAVEHGLVDELGDKITAEEHLKTKYGIEEINYVVYEEKAGFFDLLSTVFTDFSFSIGEGIGAALLSGNSPVLWT